MIVLYSNMPQTKEKLRAKALNSWGARGCVDTIRVSPYTREREGGRQEREERRDEEEGGMERSEGI